jgi:glycosyltransferase involved in cell wall biosynthesis
MKPKVLLLSDDIRSVSGVARISKDIILNTVDKFDWVQLAAKHDHEEDGHIIDVSKATEEMTGVSDAYVRLYANTGYGDEMTLRRIIKHENPDLILHITDPRYWGWLYAMERYVRQTIPICYYHVWDNEPPPKFNKGVYKSCDWIGCISELTYKMVKQVDTDRQPWQTSYIPHGVCPIKYHPTGNADLTLFKKQILGDRHYKFVVLSNNVNIPRKQLTTILSAYSRFGDSLPTSEQNDILLLMHTNPKFTSGGDLYSVAKDLCPVHDVIFSTTLMDDTHLNYLYNISDVTINVASNEGFGLSTLESILAGTPIIVSKTGGLVDQIHEEEGHHGVWASAIKPAVRNLTSSQQVPYIYSDICSEVDVANEISVWYNMTDGERRQCGESGRSHATVHLTSQVMCDKIANGLHTTLKKFIPRDRISLLTT